MAMLNKSTEITIGCGPDEAFQFLIKLFGETKMYKVTDQFPDLRMMVVKFGNLLTSGTYLEVRIREHIAYENSSVIMMAPTRGPLISGGTTVFTNNRVLARTEKLIRDNL